MPTVPSAGKVRSDVVDEPARDQSWTCLPCPHPPQPLQAVTSDDTVMIVGAIGVTDRAAIAHHVVQVCDWFTDHHERREGQQGRCQARHEYAEMDIAGEHHVRGPHPARGRNDALAHTGRIERDRGQILKNSGARFLGERGKAQCIVVRIDVKRLPIVHGAKISRTAQLIAHAFNRPIFNIGTDPAHALNLVVQLGRIVCLRHM